MFYSDFIIKRNQDRNDKSYFNENIEKYANPENNLRLGELLIVLTL
jgi:hypothetical protein